MYLVDIGNLYKQRIGLWIRMCTSHNYVELINPSRT